MAEAGYTYKEIEMDQVPITRKIEIIMSSDSEVGISKSMGLALISFAEYFHESKPDALLVLGDRYETLAVCCAAMNACIPIAHLYGGETTEGAIDEAIRHMITKMSYFHFTATEDYRRRVIQLGESPERVYCVGSMGVENACNVHLLSKKELEKELGIEFTLPYAVVTFHPVTLEEKKAEQEINELLQALTMIDDMQFIITKANADKGGKKINECLEQFVEEHSNLYLFDSLGMKRYLSAVQHCEMVIGNSSSGLIEVPAFHKPTVNIGNRQRGRICGKTVLNCETNNKAIIETVQKARTKEFIEICKNADNPYQQVGTSDFIVKKIKSELLFGNINLMKQFYDLK
jgi:GDP/UDP-N,N'-diacetylbacillosamine 2-epimerase (hydrolysing)